MIFLDDKLTPLCEKYFEKEYFITNSLFFWGENFAKNLHNYLQLKRCLRYYTFIFSISKEIA
jgi:hypothetical protein